ncbi:unnamed protein product [Symbiodinium natans]|uniref:Uncharacterized protein n=1 Tax=Symbiodinium natans TaxID=878477 RepID=A0A812KAB0_9DINO|nr:unnamed protein product [Symbiodinium natans]
MAYRANMPIRTETRNAFDDGRHDFVGAWEQLVYMHEGRLALFAHPARDDHSTPTAEASASGAARHTPLGAFDLPTTMAAHTGPSEPHLGVTGSTPLGASSSTTTLDEPMGPAEHFVEAKRPTPLGASDSPSAPDDFMPSTETLPPSPQPGAARSADMPNEPRDLRHIRSLLVDMHNHLACQDALSRTLMQAAESRRLELHAVSAQLQETRASLALAQQAYTDLRHELDSTSADFLAYRIRTEAELYYHCLVVPLGPRGYIAPLPRPIFRSRPASRILPCLGH